MCHDSGRAVGTVFVGSGLKERIPPGEGPGGNPLFKPCATPAARLAQMIFLSVRLDGADLRAFRSRRLISPRRTEKNHFHLIMHWARKLAQLLCYHASRSSSRLYGSATVREVSRSATGRAFRVLHLVCPATA